MRSKKKQPAKLNPPVYRELPPKDATGSEIEPGAIGQAAITAAALDQLNRYAKDIEDFLATSRMETILNELSTELHPERTNRPPLRLRRD